MGFYDKPFLKIERILETNLMFVPAFMRPVFLGMSYLAWPIGIESSIRFGKLTFPAGGPDREDDIREYTLGTRLRLSENSIGRRVEYSIKLNRYESKSNVDNFDRDRTTIGIGAVVGF